MYGHDMYGHAQNVIAGPISDYSIHSMSCTKI